MHRAWHAVSAPTSAIITLRLLLVEHRQFGDGKSRSSGAKGYQG